MLNDIVLDSVFKWINLINSLNFSNNQLAAHFYNRFSLRCWFQDGKDGISF